MKSNIPYPDERLLIVRPCQVSLCLGVHSAAKTLSALLYRYSRLCGDNEGNEANEIDQDAIFRVYCRQSDLVKDMIDEITEKTLHNTAIPWLQFLGYLEIEELPGKNCYILHIGRIFKGLAAYTKDLKNKTHCQLEEFLIDVPELKKVLIAVKGLEEFLINKRNFQLALEKILIDNRKNSNCQRGRKPRPQAASDGNSEAPKIINRDSSFRNKNKEDSIPNEPDSSTIVANATIPFVSSSDDDDLEQKTSHIVIEATNKNAEPKTTRNHQSLEQNPLFDTTPKSPAMPPESAKWCAETVVQIVEFRRNKRFLEDARGKNQKSQRERQLDAAKKIIDAKITREEFIKAYDARNDAWWQDNRGDLTVVDMAAKTTKGVMRTLEVLENIDSKKGVKTQSNGRQAQPSQCNSILTQEEKDFRKWLVSQPKEERPKILKARREARLAAQAQA